MNGDESDVVTGTTVGAGAVLPPAAAGGALFFFLAGIANSAAFMAATSSSAGGPMAVEVWLAACLREALEEEDEEEEEVLAWPDGLLAPPAPAPVFEVGVANSLARISSAACSSSRWRWRARISRRLESSSSAVQRPISSSSRRSKLTSSEGAGATSLGISSAANGSRGGRIPPHTTATKRNMELASEIVREHKETEEVYGLYRWSERSM